MTDIVERVRWLASGQDDPQSQELIACANEIERLREALFRIADHPVEQSRQWEVGANEMIRLARMAISGEFKSPFDALAEENDRMRTFLIAVSRAARKMGDDDLADDCCAALGEGK
jgi:hypothetical protein